jgi:hypothetical protein
MVILISQVIRAITSKQQTSSFRKLLFMALGDGYTAQFTFTVTRQRM